MNKPNKADFVEKLQRVRAYMERSGYGAVILGRRDNTAWLTGGGDFKVLRDVEAAFGVLLVTMDRVYLVAQYMDVDRIWDDELEGLGIEKVSLYWYEEAREARALKLAGDVRAVSDIPMAGADCKTGDIYWLHYPLTDHDITVYREAAEKCDRLLFDIAQWVEPGMTEQQVEAMIIAAYVRENMTPKVVLVGSDERLGRYRHPNASFKKIEKVVLLHPAASYRGLHVNITRMVCFGELPKTLEMSYDLLNLLEAQTMALMRPGTHFAALLEERKRLLEAHGMVEEARYHYPGALTGYMLATTQPFLDGSVFTDRMAMDNFITVKGAKVEEISISGPGGAELISAGFAWPTKTYRYQDSEYALPVILQR